MRKAIPHKRIGEPRIDNRFVAIAFGVYDSRTRTLTVANSGFPRPFLVRGTQVEEIRVEGIPLGMLPKTQYEQKLLVDLCLQAVSIIFNQNRLRTICQYYCI